MKAYANDIIISTFDDLINSHPQNGDTLEFADDLTSDASIRNTFINLDITFQGHNHFLDGKDAFSGFILNQDSLFNEMQILNCKGQRYNASSFAGAIFNNQGQLNIKNSIFSNNFVDSNGLNFGVAGAVYNLNDGSVSIDSSLFSDNYTLGASSFGGAVANGYQSNLANMTINNSIFNNNYSYGTVVPYGGAIFNNGTLDINNTLFNNNYAEGPDNSFAYGGAIYNIGNLKINNSLLNGNYVKSGNYSFAYGGAIANFGNISINNTVIRNNSVSSNQESLGGAVYNEINGTITIKNSIIENNTINQSGTIGEGGAIYNKGEFVIENTTLRENYDKAGSLNDIYNTSTGKLTFDSNGTTNVLSGIKGEGNIYKKGSGILNLGGVNKNYTGNFSFEEGRVNLLANSSYFNATNTNFENNIEFNMQNGIIDNVNFGNLTVSGTANIFPDVNFNTNTMDTISASGFSGGVLNVGGLYLEGVPKSDYISIPFADSILKDHVHYNSTIIKTPIYSYNANYNSADGNFEFIRENFTPSILASAVATQLAGYLTQIDSYRNIFSNLDMVMIIKPEAQTGYEYQNKFASSMNQFTFSPFNMPEEHKGVWFKPYTTFENVPLKRGPRVSNVSYGSMFGVESGLNKLKRGWYSLYGAYASYNGSHQAYEGIGIYNNGGLTGLYGVFYKGNFFSAWTANAGANVGEASTMFGRDEFAMLNTGIAQKTGYNFQTKERQFIIQPSLLMSYSFINTFNYTAASGASIDTKPLHALHIEPQIKLIGNFKEYMQPYICVSMIWNVIDHARFQADDVYLPSLSVKPFVQYGIGVQKRWGDRLTGFFETMMRNGGRNGIALQFGLRFSI
ncbi:MAG: hypothetical protein KHX03_04965 [Clostridium sp.]|nr:hypothetical protein [Clostridium sp.]